VAGVRGGGPQWLARAGIGGAWRTHGWSLGPIRVGRAEPSGRFFNKMSEPTAVGKLLERLPFNTVCKGMFGSNGKRKRKCKTFAFLHFFCTFGFKHLKMQKGKCYRNFANYGLIRINRFVSSFSPHLCN
jgi:hypothetical protein